MKHSIFYLLHSSSQISALFAHRLLHHHQHKVLGFVTLSSMKSNVMTDSDCILIAYLQFSAFPVRVKVFFKAPAQSPWGVALADFWEVCTPCFHPPGTRQPALLLCSNLPGATIHSCSEVHVVILYVAWSSDLGYSASPFRSALSCFWKSRSSWTHSDPVTCHLWWF